jgi:hypothetical protein
MDSTIGDYRDEKQSVWAELPSFVERGDGYIDGWKPAPPIGDDDLDTLMGESSTRILRLSTPADQGPGIRRDSFGRHLLQNDPRPYRNGWNRARLPESIGTPRLRGVAQLMPPDKTGKEQAGRFPKGKSGNPDGRPFGGCRVRKYYRRQRG